MPLLTGKRERERVKDRGREREGVRDGGREREGGGEGDRNEFSIKFCFVET